MAASRCLKCGNQSFEAVSKIPIGSPRRILFIQCTVCGSVIGVLEETHPAVKNQPTPILIETEKPSSVFTKQEPVIRTRLNTIFKQLYG